MTTMNIDLQTDPPINVVDLSMSKDSQILSISIYPGRAEINRQFEFEIKAGQNKVTIIDVPPTLIMDTLSANVDSGQEKVFLNDVNVTRTGFHSQSDSSAVRSNDALVRKKEQIKTAIGRARKSQKFLDSYLKSVSGSGPDISRLRLETALNDYNALCEKLDLQIINLKNELAEVRHEISKNEEDPSLLVSGLWKVSFNLYGQLDQRVKVQLKYGVHSVDWRASYDVRVDTHSQCKKVTILYKAAITQITGEAWINVPVTMETTNPLGLQDSPELQPWYIFTSPTEEPDRPRSKRSSSHRRSWFRKSRSPRRGTIQPTVLQSIPPSNMPTMIYPPPQQEDYFTSERVPYPPIVVTERPQARRGRSPTISSERSHSSRSSSRSRSRSLEFLSRSPRSRSPRQSNPLPTSISPVKTIEHQEVEISDKGNIVATFRVPGLVYIPSDREKHYVTVAELNFDGTLLRYGMPSIDERVYLKADIKNESDYLFIQGSAKIYVDGSFIATTRISPVYPRGAFSLPLGLDPSIQLTYHPLEKRFNKSRFFQNTSTISCTQRITILSTKSSVIDNLKVIDNVPISGDPSIEVKILNPALGDPSAMPIAKANQQVQVSPNIVAHWDGADDPNIDQSEVGSGKISWRISTVQPLEKILLSLQYEISAPENLTVSGI